MRPKAFKIQNDNVRSTNDYKDEPLTCVYEISLEQILAGTQRELAITREIRSSDGTFSQDRQVYTIKIEPGCKEGHCIRLNEVGNRDPINIPADLFITILSKPHRLFKRNNANLIYIKSISYADSRSAKVVQAPLLDGTTAYVDPKGTIDIDTELVLDRYGLPDPSNSGVRGRLLIRFDIQAPAKQINWQPISTNEKVEENIIDILD
ncbi:unnamed protein product [Rotaria sp. Silwood2]|nr:unnamed protein product [Rotaria sp. Silwood2]CAF2565306.1 unnamed protein product [Rotaria sp. Silwood2]CAF2969294.1 unnamed protein product [Rotaria sp. Silwood2]CAF3377271.1 unnamed protein product [Rotaria sp. Silwood2]CAF3926311.1 unnamed protein product [Rotaria sp. Silwood2]